MQIAQNRSELDTNMTKGIFFYRFVYNLELFSNDRFLAQSTTYHIKYQRCDATLSASAKLKIIASGTK